jgi:hypothetical protein
MVRNSQTGLSVLQLAGSIDTLHPPTLYQQCPWLFARGIRLSAGPGKLIKHLRQLRLAHAPSTRYAVAIGAMGRFGGGRSSFVCAEGSVQSWRLESPSIAQVRIWICRDIARGYATNPRESNITCQDITRSQRLAPRTLLE